MWPIPRNKQMNNGHFDPKWCILGHFGLKTPQNDQFKMTIPQKWAHLFFMIPGFSYSEQLVL